MCNDLLLLARITQIDKTKILTNFISQACDSPGFTGLINSIDYGHIKRFSLPEHLIK